MRSHEDLQVSTYAVTECRSCHFPEEATRCPRLHWPTIVMRLRLVAPTRD